MAKSATRLGHKVDKIHVTQASASEIRAALGIKPAEKKVAAKAIAAAKKPATAHRVTVAQKPKAARASAAKRVHAR
ncbi:MAG TPA: hypothetical protein VNW71_24775 [Thermoanaerobaculia bacterium]|nr:hypothetical protein [Thermoanaerobaculia bacterium]